jgi:hypothetical protein
VVEVLRSYAGESNALLSARMTRQMLTPPKGWYGLGYFVVEVEGGTRFHRPGWNEGYHSFMGGHVGTGYGMVWMTNGENGMLLGLEVLRGMAKILGWPDFRSKENAVTQVDPAIYPANWPPTSGGSLPVREGTGICTLSSQMTAE